MKNPKIKEQQQLKFYAVTATMTRDELVVYCTKLIKNARAPNHTLINDIKSMGKGRMMIATNNFIMKGQNYGV
tara:strand:- start:671 stop:889 length:219 start_codon:yes stop_codon:yes gene_type:complete